LDTIDNFLQAFAFNFTVLHVDASNLTKSFLFSLGIFERARGPLLQWYVSSCVQRYGSPALVVLLLQPAIVKMMKKNIVSSQEIISEVSLRADAIVSPGWFPSAADHHWGYHFYPYGSSAQPNSFLSLLPTDVSSCP
jgi:hypothetical protein